MKAKDLFGGLVLPGVVPDVSDSTNLPRGIGDPALAIVGSFLATVLLAELGAAAAALWPGYPELVGDAPLGAGAPPVRRIHLYQPGVTRPWVASDLPGLFVFRNAGEKSKYEVFTSDTPRATVPIVVWWMADAADREWQEAMDPYLNAVAKAMLGALSYGYHRAWVIDADREKPASLGTFATATTVQTIAAAAFNGGLAGARMEPARPLLIQTMPAVGAYNTTDPIVFSGIDGRGQPWSDSITPTLADGGESFQTLWRFRDLESIGVPAQLATTGSLVVGYAASPESASGSRFMRAAGLSACVPRHAGEVKPLVIKVGESQEPVLYRALEMVLDAPEDYAPTPILHAAGPTGMDGSYVLLPSGDIFAHDVL